MGHQAKKCPLNVSKEKENHQANPKTIQRKQTNGEGQESNTSEEDDRKNQTQKNISNNIAEIESKDPNAQKNHQIREKNNEGPKEDDQFFLENLEEGKRDEDFLSSTLKILPEAKENGFPRLEDIPIQGLSLDIHIPILNTNFVECSPLSDPLNLMENTTPNFVKDSFKVLSQNTDLLSENMNQPRNGLMDTLPWKKKRIYDKE